MDRNIGFILTLLATLSMQTLGFLQNWLLKHLKIDSPDLPFKEGKTSNKMLMQCLPVLAKIRNAVIPLKEIKASSMLLQCWDLEFVF